jgi:8-oxo-dGTP diphosphatase
MTIVKKRRRGTVIVETSKGILLTAGRHGRFILPGGGANRGESRFVAALRELTEETHLLPHYAEIIFRHEGKVSDKHMFQNCHTVCFVKASGTPKPGGGDAKRIAYFFPGCNVPISITTKEIIERFYEWKSKNQPLKTSQVEDDGDESTEDVVYPTHDYDDGDE